MHQFGGHSPSHGELIVKTARFIIALCALAFAPQTLAAAPAIPPSAPQVKLSTDAYSYQSLFLGTQAGKGVNLTTPLKSMYVCIGYQTCGGAGPGLSPGAVNSESTAVGWSSLSKLTTGVYNTAIGVGTLRNETTGSNNVALGVDSFGQATGNANSIAVGVTAGQLGTHSNDTIVGTGALVGQNSTSGADNTVVGTYALQSSGLTTPSGNIAIGRSAMGSGAMTSPSQNTIIGTYSAGNVTTAGANTGVGYAVFQVLTSGSNNVVLGYGTADALTTASNNLVLGFNVGSATLATGGSNILIGTSNAVDTVSGSTFNEINIGKTYIGYSTAPTATSGFGTSPSITGSGTAAFRITVGASGTPSSSTVIGFGTAPITWNCMASDQTTNITGRQTASSSTSATITWSAAPSLNDVLLFQCAAI